MLQFTYITLLYDCIFTVNCKMKIITWKVLFHYFAKTHADLVSINVHSNDGDRRRLKLCDIIRRTKMFTSISGVSVSWWPPCLVADCNWYCPPSSRLPRLSPTSTGDTSHITHHTLHWAWGINDEGGSVPPEKFREIYTFFKVITTSIQQAIPLLI